MNPTSNETAGMNLPPPVSAESLSMAPETIVSPSLEAVGKMPPETSFKPAQPAGYPLPIPTAPLPQLPITNVSNTTGSSSPSVADDTDLIEKEWVQKAKEIINKTQDDPHEQSKELNIFKADYMQKRYNKVLKLSE